MGVAEAFLLSIDLTLIEMKRVIERKKRKGERRETKRCAYICRERYRTERGREKRDKERNRREIEKTDREE